MDFRTLFFSIARQDLQCKFSSIAENFASVFPPTHNTLHVCFQAEKNKSAFLKLVASLSPLTIIKLVWNEWVLFLNWKSKLGSKNLYFEHIYQEYLWCWSRNHMLLTTGTEYRGSQTSVQPSNGILPKKYRYFSAYISVT